MSRSLDLSSLPLLLLVPALRGAQRGGGAAAGERRAVRRAAVAQPRPARGGRSIAVAGSDAGRYEYYMGATGGGLWKTTDAGISWKPVTDGLINHSSVGAVAVAAVEPRCRLHRHRRSGHPRQHNPGRRRLQVDRRRQDLDAHRPRRHAGHREDPRPPGQSRSRLCRGVRPPRGAESRARRLPVEGRRQDLGEGSLPRQQDRRERAGTRSEEPAGDLRRAVGGVPQRVRDVERRPG